MTAAGGDKGAARVQLQRLQPEDVRSALQRLKPKKSSGLDDTKVGLLLFTLYTIASTEKCTTNPKSDNPCEINLTCVETLDGFSEIESDDCFTDPAKTPRITVQIENVDIAGKIDTLSAKILDNTIQFVIKNGNLSEVPDKIYEMNRLETIDFSYNKIKTIDIAKLTNTNLKKITIENNEINNLVKKGSPLSKDTITEIYLSFNKIQSIPDYYFDQCTNLETLDLSHNSIDKLDKVHIVSLKSLQNFYLSHNKIKNIDNVFIHPEKLKVLDLNNNLIDTINTDALTTMRSIETLKLASNNLTDDVTGALEPLIKLKSLDLSNNSLSVITPKSFKENIDLSDLDLSDNEIETIAPGAFEGKRINKFNFKNNKLKGALQSSMFVGLVPTELDLSYGAITEIGPECFSNMTTLEKLNLNNNAINNINISAFDKNSALLHLDLSYNKLNSIDFKTDNLKQLTNLTVSYNNINECKPDVFKNFTQLTYLDISNNQITKLEKETFKSMVELKTLDMHKNPLKNIDEDSFRGMTKLEKLSIQETYLPSILSKFFSDMTDLEYLNASSSQIKIIEKTAFGANIKLKELYLDNNQIKDVSEVFNGLTNLVLLNLSKNDIQNVDTSTFSSLSKLDTVDLSFNEKLILNNAFDNLPTLKRVNLRKIKGISFEKIENSVISELDVSFCSIKDVNAIHINRLRKIAKLNLCDNEISSINENSFKGMTSLNTLHLCRNKINHVEPTSFDSANLLQELDLSDNELPKISYGTLNKLLNLKTLNLTNNNLKDFPPGNLPNGAMKINLILDGNFIDDLDFEGFYAQDHVTSLSIGGNLFMCSDLQAVRNKFKNIPMTTVKFVNDTENIKSFEGITCRLPTTTSKPTNQPVSTSTNNTKLSAEHVDEIINNIINYLAGNNTLITSQINDIVKLIVKDINRSTSSENKLLFENLKSQIDKIKELFSNVDRDARIFSEKLDKFTVEKNKTDEWIKSNQSLFNISQQIDQSNAEYLKKNTELSDKITNTEVGVKNEIESLKSVYRSDSTTTKTLAYIAAVSSMIFLTTSVVKCIINYKK